jgi:lipopolysaccharide transport system ATP-binding protein
MNAAISVRNLTKIYRIYSKRGQKFKEVLTLNRRMFHETRKAVQDVSFEVMPGECFGIIGNNGSGKSSILKIIAGTSYATSGTVDVTGEISYLLDVSTGFNPEFTGLEHIHIKCALLGLHAKQVDAILPSIIEFSGLHDRLNHPLRTYSTGMVMRLGFSVAIHLPFEVLIVDEILSVGDYLFQRKCITAIRSLLEQGKTVLITSHSISDIASFCDRLLLLDKGRMALMGKSEKVIEAYLEDCEGQCREVLTPKVVDPVFSAPARSVGSATIVDVRFFDNTKTETTQIKTGQSLLVTIRAVFPEPVENPCVRIQFINADGLLLLGTNTYRHEMKIGTVSGMYEFSVEFSDLPVLGGEYYVNVGLWPDEWKSYTSKAPFDLHEYRYKICVTSKRSGGTGLARSNSTWTLQKTGEAK